MKRWIKRMMAVTLAVVFGVLTGLSQMPPLQAEAQDHPAVPDPVPKLVYGNPNLPDEDAFVLLIFGDGFTKDQQQTFFDEAQKTADYVMATSPWDEFEDTIKIYALGVVSNESGAKGDAAINQEQADADARDTYFGSSYWTGGMQRLLTISEEGAKRAEELTGSYLPDADYNVVIVNAETYGGSGGTTCVASLNNESLEMMLHELGHTTAKLADEYFAGASYAGEYPNMTAQSDPEKVKWSRFIGKNGVGVYEYDNGGDGWYRPHENCKMRFLGKQYAFCEVCKEQIRKTFCQASNVTKLFYQQYADVIYEQEAGKGTDMRQYFILRKGDHEITGDQLGEALQLVYKDEAGNILTDIPYAQGTYLIEASFAGNEQYDACTQTAEYTIEPEDLFDVTAQSKVFDGQPAEIQYKLDYDGEYEVKLHFTGTIPYAAEITYDYDSEEAPVKPGRYQVALSAYEKQSGRLISRTSRDFTISFRTTAVSNHDTGEYPGAMPYYNNKTIVFTGEGYTAEEQKAFEEKANAFIAYFRNMEPFKEADLYMNYHTVEAVSEESGIGKQEKDTYFRLTYDENGNIRPTDYSTEGAMYIGNNIVTSYYKATIVLVNDSDVKKGATVTNKRFTVYTGSDDEGMEYAAKELLNYFTGKPEGYRASEEESEAQRTEFLKALYYTWYGWDYAPILSRAYQETFVENGTRYDLAPYFHTYILGQEAEGLTYRMTYFADENGKPGKELEQAPDTAGIYHVRAELVPEEGKDTTEVKMGDTVYHIPLSRGWTTYTIQEKQNDGGEEIQQTVQENKTPGTPDGSDDKPKEKAVKTGDTAPIGLWIGIGAAAIIVVIGTLIYRKRR